MRKHALLRSRADCFKDVSLDDIRSDYELVRFLGPLGSEPHTSFFAQLDTADAIDSYPAPGLAGAHEAMQKLADAGYAIIALTGRQPTLREATLRELTAATLSERISQLITVPAGVTRGTVCEAKSRLLAELQSQYVIVAVIGDRPTDIAAAHARGLPAILLRTTINKQERARLIDGEPELVADVHNWADVPPLVAAIEQGCEPMGRVRSEMISQYSDWLAHLDGKASICVMISGALSAVSGQLLFSHLEGLRTEVGGFSIAETSLLLLAFSTAVLSLLYAIQAYTSRRTSGEHSGQPVRAVMRQWVGTLGAPLVWSRVPGDACDDLQKLRAASAAAQTHAHMRLLFRRYRTIDLDVVSNLRLFELRAANYQKLYAERLASKLLQLAIFLVFAWIVVEIVDVTVHLGAGNASQTSPPSINRSSQTTLIDPATTPVP